MVKALNPLIVKAYSRASLTLSDGWVISKHLIIEDKKQAIINWKESSSKQARPVVVLDKLGQAFKKCSPIKIHSSMVIETKWLVYWWGWGEVHCLGREKVT